VTLEGKTLSTAIAWCTQSLKHCGDIAILDILAAIESLLRGNGSKVGEVCSMMLNHYHVGVSDHCKNIIYSMECSPVNLKIFSSGSMKSIHDSFH